MFGRAVLGKEPPQIDDAADAAAAGGLGEAARGLTVERGEVVAAGHRMDQIVGDLDPVQGLFQARSRVQVALVDPDAPRPRAADDPSRVADEDAHLTLRPEQARNEPPAHISRRPRDQDPFHQMRYQLSYA